MTRCFEGLRSFGKEESGGQIPSFLGFSMSRARGMVSWHFSVGQLHFKPETRHIDIRNIDSFSSVHSFAEAGQAQ